MVSRLRHPWQSMSARLLLLTVGFVMLAEVLIFAPSVGRYWEDWLKERLAAGHLAVLSLAATPDLMIGPELEAELLSHVGAYAVSVRTADHGKLMLMVQSMPESVAETIDLEAGSGLDMIGYALSDLFSDEDQVIRVLGTSPRAPGTVVEIVIDDLPLKEHLRAFALRIFLLSLVISVFTASLVYLALHLLLVRPMRRVTESMVDFQNDPERAAIYAPHGRRSDEIGLAEHALAEMQQGLRDSLRQKEHLAALGTAVSKINHDLRNILTTARLVSDSMAESADPRVRRTAPTLMRTIDRAVDLCQRTLSFARSGEMRLHPQLISLANLVEEVGQGLPAVLSGDVAWATEVSGGLHIRVDRDQIQRAIANLAQNAVEAGATRIAVAAELDRAHGRCTLLLADDGPGLPKRAQDNLFQPFAGSARDGGTGLGLAIAREIVEAHQGTIALVSTGADGTVFRIDLPAAGGGTRRRMRAGARSAAGVAGS